MSFYNFNPLRIEKSQQIVRWFIIAKHDLQHLLHLKLFGNTLLTCMFSTYSSGLLMSFAKENPCRLFYFSPVFNFSKHSLIFTSLVIFWFNTVCIKLFALKVLQLFIIFNKINPLLVQWLSYLISSKLVSTFFAIGKCNTCWMQWFMNSEFVLKYWEFITIIEN